MYPPAALVEVHLDRETEVANSALHLIVVDPTLAVCSLWVLSHTSLVLPRCVFFFGSGMVSLYFRTRGNCFFVLVRFCFQFAVCSICFCKRPMRLLTLAD